ncbi:MAG: MerR family transcriptional regulator [Clostridia bacterium]|nr:MerR family transcriptional regulator [Clostridia bacterium]
MRTVNEVSKLTGVSVRTLHHYDAIGLLKPTKVTEAGYRLYDDAALSRLQSILLFRELQFPLKEIKAILDCPVFDPTEALTQQIALLEMQQKRIGELISFARELQCKGVKSMKFEAFDKTEIERYKAEAKAKWGQTQAYREYEDRTGKLDDQTLADSAKEMMALFAQIGAMRSLPPDDPAVQKKISDLQSFITKHYYTCTDEIFLGLGQMYTADERFRRNIDRAGGEGTAEFVKQAILIYCQK